MIKANSSVRFHFLTSCSLQSRQALKDFIVSVFKQENRALENINIVFCDDEYLFALNRQFLQHDYYTDILSFQLSDNGKPLEAEIYISVERVRENAPQVSASFKKELHRVIFHGILHFCGYKDKSPTDIRRMRAMEDWCLNSYFNLIS